MKATTNIAVTNAPISSHWRSPAVSASTVAARTLASPSSAVLVVMIVNCAACKVAVNASDARSASFSIATRVALAETTSAVARVLIAPCVAWACSATASCVALM